jgi:seryl-tRNA synthetase
MVNQDSSYEVKVNALAELSTSIPDELVEEFIKRLPYVSEGIRNACLLPGATQVAFDLQPGFENQASAVAACISEVAGKLCLNHRPGVFKTLAKQDTLPSGFCADPHPLLTEQGEIVLFGRGRYGFGPKVVALMEAFDSCFRQMATDFRAPAHTFPTLIGADLLDRCRYFLNFPASLNMVSHLREDHRLLQEFSRSASWDGEKLACDPASFSPVQCLLSPAVCFHWYAWLANSKLAAPRVITAVGKCFRYESSNLTGLERLWDFTMREIIFVGPGEWVMNNRRTCLDLAVQFLDAMKLAYQITSATDPFFADTFAAQAAYQQGFELKFELLVPLPYSGKKLAVGSVNYHQDFFGRAFQIEVADTSAHTGCFAFGLERLALAFLAQHGIDEKNWPDAVTSRIRAATSLDGNA